jgi:FkbM family methyltransferase
MYSQKKYSKLPSAKNAYQLLKIISETGLFCTPRKIDRPIVLYGAGNFGRFAKKYLDSLNIKIEFVVDVQAEQIRKDMFWAGIQVLSPDQVAPKDRKSYLLAITVVTASYCDIALPLHRNGWHDVVPFYDVAEAYKDRHPLTNGWSANLLTENDVNRLKTVLLKWSDDISRAHHIQFLAWRCIREEWIFSYAPIRNDNKFFIPEIRNNLTENEIFADVGAHVGSVTQKFIKIVNKKFNKIFMFEPDSKNLAHLKTNTLRSYPDLYDKIEISSEFIGKNCDNILFAEGYGYASQKSLLGSKLLNTVPFDDLNIAATFIKLHLEGGELEALFGSRKTIIKNRPIIAVTSYHNSLGIYALPEWLMTELNDYNIIMRLHSWCGTGAVIYCIPKERSSIMTSLG